MYGVILIFSPIFQAHGFAPFFTWVQISAKTIVTHVSIPPISHAWIDVIHLHPFQWFGSVSHSEKMACMMHSVIIIASGWHFMFCPLAFSKISSFALKHSLTLCSISFLTSSSGTWLTISSILASSMSCSPVSTPSSRAWQSKMHWWFKYKSDRSNNYRLIIANVHAWTDLRSQNLVHLSQAPVDTFLCTVECSPSPVGLECRSTVLFLQPEIKQHSVGIISSIESKRNCNIHFSQHQCSPRRRQVPEK